MVLGPAVTQDETRLAAEAARIRALHEARAQSELSAADALAPGSDSVTWRGSLIPEVVLLKGMPGPAEVSGGAAVSGADGAAAAKALERLGHDPDRAFFALTRPEATTSEEARVARVRAIVEAVDAPLVIALDREAAEDVGAAFGLATVAFGRQVQASGRRIVAVEGLEASLADEKLKPRVWRQFKAAAPAGPVF